MGSNHQQARPYPIRMTEDMRDYLEEKAFINKRSLHAEIMMRLERSIEEEKFHEDAEGYTEDLPEEVDPSSPRRLVVDITPDDLLQMIEESNQKLFDQIAGKYVKKSNEESD